MIDCSPRQGGGEAVMGESYPYTLGFICECIECGYLIESEVHCRDITCPRCNGQMRRYERPGPGQSRAYQGEPVYQGIPTGNFVSPYVEVIDHPNNIIPVGEQIKLRAHYEAYCPGQPFLAPAWTVSVKAVGNGIAVKNDTTHMTEGPVASHPYLNAPGYPIMPNRAVTLEVSLWGNPDAWQELDLTDP